MNRRWPWLLLPCLALLELLAHQFFARRAPRLEEWRAIVEPVRRLKRPGDALLVSPAWAEPLGRHVLGDSLWPIPERARANLFDAERVLEVSILGQSEARLESWPLAVEEQVGAFNLSVRKNPDFRAPLFRVTEAIERGAARVFRKHEGTRYECEWKTNAPSSTGGLHGHVAFPRRRFVCGALDVEFVGVTIIDDQNYQPRRCVWAHPSKEGALWLRFEDVPLGSEIRGYTGLSHFLMRDGAGTDVTLDVFVNGRQLGQVRHQDRAGWSPFKFATGVAGDRGRVEFRVSSERFENRHFCFAAETSG